MAPCACAFLACEDAQRPSHGAPSPLGVVARGLLLRPGAERGTSSALAAAQRRQTRNAASGSGLTRRSSFVSEKRVFLLADLRRRREVEARRQEDHLIEFERAVLGVDPVVREVAVRSRAA